jgi:cobalt-zinc-cadmium resistance protein CzcA
VTNVQVQIITLFPGHAAEEVEKLVTIPIENQMNGIPKRASMRSISMFGLSQVTIVFEDDADSNTSATRRSRRWRRSTCRPARAPAFRPDATPVGEIYRYTLEAPKAFRWSN